MSVMLSRIDFDPQEIADKEEADLAHEDAQQQQELKAFLDQELNDVDLFDTSFTPHQSQAYSTYQPNAVPSAELNISQDDNLNDVFQHQLENDSTHIKSAPNMQERFKENHIFEDPYGEEIFQNGYHEYPTNQPQYQYSEYEEESIVPRKGRIQNNLPTDYYEEPSDSGRRGDHEDKSNQLHILYTVRGKKIEELENKIDVLQEETSKEKRVFQHKLALVTSDRDGLKQSNIQLQSLLQEHKQNISSLYQHIQNEQEENKKLNSKINELDEKLELSESTIDSLQEQIKMMNQTESLSRARSQHESMLATMRQKHEEEILILKEKVDDLQQALAWKIEDNNRYREMLDSSSTASEVGILRHRLTTEETKNKRLSEELDKEKKSVSELEVHLKMLETVVKKPVQFSSTPFDQNQLLQFKTPVSRFEVAKDISAETPISGESSIRSDLVKALAMNREKREEIKALQERINQLTSKKDRSETELQNSMEILSRAPSTPKTMQSCKDCAQTKKECTDKITKLNKKHQKEVEDLQNENAIIKTNMADLVKNSDKEKTIFFKKQNETMLQFVDDAKEKLRADLKGIHESEKHDLKTQLQQLSQELTYAKEEYVRLSEEMKLVETNVQNESNHHNLLQTSDLKLKLETEYKNQLLKKENELTSKYIEDLENEKKKWQRKSEKHLADEIEKAVTFVKLDLHTEYESQKEKDLQLALKQVKVKEKQKLDEEQIKHNEMVKTLTEEWEEKLKKREDDLQQEIDKLRAKFKAERDQNMSYKISENNQISDLQAEIDKLQSAQKCQCDKLKQSDELQSKLQSLEIEKNEMFQIIGKSEDKVKDLQMKIRVYEGKIKEFQDLKDEEEEERLLKGTCNDYNTSYDEPYNCDHTGGKCDECLQLNTKYRNDLKKWKNREEEYLKVLTDAQEQLQRALDNTHETPEFLPEKLANTMAENRLNYILRTKEKLWSIKEVNYKKDIENLKDDCVSYDSQLSVIEGKYQELEKKIREIEKENLEVNARFSNEKIQKESLQEKIIALNKTLEDVNKALSFVQTDAMAKQMKIDELEFERTRSKDAAKVQIEEVIIAEKKKWQVEASKLQSEKLKEESERLKNNLLSQIQHQTDSERFKTIKEEYKMEVKELKQNFRDKLERISESKKKWMNEEEEKRKKLQLSFEQQLKERLTDLQSKHDKLSREQQGVWERNMLQLQKEHSKLMTTLQNDASHKEKEYQRQTKELQVELSTSKQRISQVTEDYEERIRKLKELHNTLKSKAHENDVSPYQINDDLIEKMRQFYVNTLQQINKDVATHVKVTREKATQEIKEAVRRERRYLLAKCKEKKARGKSERNYETSKHTHDQAPTSSSWDTLKDLPLTSSSTDASENR